MTNEQSTYHIIGLIGQGQFGRVFCAIHSQTGEIVALKDLQLKRFSTKKFLRELDFISTLEHPNIVACNALKYHAHGRYLVMDYCEGGTLRDLMELEAEISLGQKLKLVEDILSGLAHAHSRHIIHCDIKPENILLNVIPCGWLARITDFGIARLIEESSMKQPGGYTGSPAYMAPERFYGQHSYATDIYAVGVILYELLTGKRPFSGYPSELMTAHMSKAVKIPETVPQLLHPILETALRKLPQRRFSSANQMKQTLHLAAQKLGLNSFSSSLFLKPSPVVTTPLKLIYQTPINHPVTHLALNYPYIYLGMSHKLTCYQATKQEIKELESINFSRPILQLHSHISGCISITQSSTFNNYKISYFSSKSHLTKPVATYILSAQNLISSIAFNGKWLALAFDGNLQILKLINLRPLTPVINCPLPNQLVILDSRHGLAIFSNLEGIPNTNFRLFNRRGQIIDIFSLPLRLYSLTANPHVPHHLFALEYGQREIGILINLKPLKVTRIPLYFSPIFIVPSPAGYWLANHQGNINLISPQGKILSSFKTGEKLQMLTSLAEKELFSITYQNQKYFISHQEVELN